MKVVFIGASQFGLKCLSAINNFNYCQVVGVVTAPKKFSISYQPEGVENVLHADFDSLSKSYDIPCITIDNGMKDDTLFELVCSWRPDIFLVVGWYHLIPKRWREFAPTYGLHASILPDYSGGAPLVWAMINGEEKTGITFFQFNDGVDSGPIVGQAKTNITVDDTIASLYERIERLGLNLIVDYLPKLADHSVVLTNQDESKRRIFPQRKPADGIIDWNRTAIEIFNFVRAQSKPYPGAYTMWQGEQIKIWNALPYDCTDSLSIQCGEVLIDTDKTIVMTKQGLLEIKEASINDQNFNGYELRRVIGDKTILGK